ncbi:uncharacterized protein LOC118194973 [Stegodyphus dumicola]|uniref:uncharacterized protein LOC118194973 n=1 Tax=Stegodyphus dumicola TaxID=202533 RepID=UPI0015AC3FC2|nr:uncharacterized protein LOC118194973 [Stegodyphus dumicola]
MAQNIRKLSILLVAVQLLNICKPTSAGLGIFGMGGGGGGSTEVAEILAAGLITKLLMEEYSSGGSMFRSLRHNLLSGYNFHPPRHYPHPMMLPRFPMMNHYALPMMHRPRYVMNPAMLHQARTQALASTLNEEIRALQASESYLDAILATAPSSESSSSSIEELLTEEDTLPTALLLSASNLVTPERSLEDHHHHQIPVPDTYETAASENESRYILPRIVRHFVQRLMRRAEHN